MADGLGCWNGFRACTVCLHVGVCRASKGQVSRPTHLLFWEGPLDFATALLPALAHQYVMVAMPGNPPTCLRRVHLCHKSRKIM
jgi:hypothetical protein